MLETIDSIDWVKMGYPHVPRWLEGLTSVDERIRKKCYWCIETYITMPEVFDGTKSPLAVLSTDVSFLIIPFLIEILESDIVLDRWLIIELLNTLGLYYKQLDKFQKNYDLHTEHLIRASKIYESVKSGINIYHQLSEHQNSLVREYASTILNDLFIN